MTQGRARAMLRMVWIVFGALVAFRPLPAGAAEVLADLYRGEAIITGQDNLEERQRGFRESLTEVLIKVSGNARLPGNPRLADVLAEAQRYVVGFSYEDRLAKKKLMDEQGTRERSFLLRVDFDPAKVDDLLGQLGARPWRGERPRVLVLLRIWDTIGRYLLTTDSRRGYGPREVLLSVSRRRGLPIVLPGGLADAEANAAVEAGAEDGAAVARLASDLGADAVLRGEMVLTPDGYWDTEWMLQDQHIDRPWRIEHTTFDRAIAAAIEDSAAALAGLE